MSLQDLSDYVEEDVTQSPLQDDGDELFLIQVPKGFDITKLATITDYAPPGVVRIETKERKRGTVTVVELGSYAGQDLNVNQLVKSGDDQVVGPRVTQSLCVSTSVHLKASSPNKHLKVVGSKTPVPMPCGLKPRFTPFGSDCPVPTKIKKKKSKRKRSGLELGVSSTCDDRGSKRLKLELLEAPTSLAPLTANRAHVTGGSLSGEAMVNGVDGMFLSPSSSVTKHKKKKRRRMEEEEGPSNASQNDSQISLNGAGLDGNIASSPSSSHHHGKKKKKLSWADETFETSVNDSILNSELDTTAGSPYSSQKKKKKKKRRKDEEEDSSNSRQNESQISLSLNGLDLDESIAPSLTCSHDQHQEKRKRREHLSDYHPVDRSINLDESTLDLDSSSMEKKSKKKKKKKEKERLS